MLGVEFINMDRWLNIGVLGGACWPTNELKITIGGHELILKPATKDTEQSIHINLKGISDIEAMTLINRFLSILAWCDDQGIENFGGGSGNPIPVTVPRKSRVVGSSIAFPFNRDIEKNTKAQLSLALYREGLTINSIPFAFLSYFKILNIFWKDKYTNGVNELIEGIRGILPCIKEGLAEKRIVNVKKKHWWNSSHNTFTTSSINPMEAVMKVSDFLEQHGYYIDSNTVEFGEIIGFGKE